MGTNYYAVMNFCEHCQRSDKVHLGKTAAGWPFLFQGSETIRNYDQWLENLMEADQVVDEYDRILTASELLEIVEEFRSNKPKEGFSLNYPETWLDQYGNHFSGYDFT